MIFIFFMLLNKLMFINSEQTPLLYVLIVYVWKYLLISIQLINNKQKYFD